MNEVTIRPSCLSDVDAMVSPSKAKRLAYEKVQPRFWRYAGDAGDHAQAEWFREILSRKDYVMLTAEYSQSGILGFIIGKLMPAPAVYSPGGLTLMVDDFCVQSEDFWDTVGAQLLEGIKVASKGEGAVQIVVVCGAHDNVKRRFLRGQNLSIASEWYVGDTG
jgi:hypothetical protein